MTSRERVRRVLNHQEADRVPVDLASTLVTGIQAGMYARLKKAMGITEGAIKVYDPFQMLAEVEEPVKQALGVDTFGIQLPTTLFGYKNENWKPFRLFDGTDVLISGHFEYDVLENGDIVQYPKGDRRARPSGRMPKGGFYFDTIVRQEPIDEAKLDPKEWVEQTYSLYTEEELRFIEDTSQYYYNNSDYALIGNFWGAGFGDIAIVPGPGILDPKGIRDPQEWYMSTVTRKSYVKEIYQYQFELQMKNLELYQQAVGDRIEVVVMSGTDFGSQNGPFISLAAYRELYKPLHTAMNDWVHQHTNWKTFYHTCGSIVKFLDDFHEAGIDILNPVQISAKGMDPELLKTQYGDKFVFWGGAIDVQHILPFSTPDVVHAEVSRNVNIFKSGGGFVFNNVHNIQSGIPVENLLAMFDALQANWSYQ
ncbi:putative methyltransferase CmuC [Candidatus Vecturithrix granuli]|uniref:Putative methyltransferase CmuC n=1 Tax=Vecturithrix granuli TaxID=1499967 RepID=A0A081C7T6_VECG1|nr:putative methyltransferase CmuC [Candidatus Vecturithrix granuli]